MENTTTKQEIETIAQRIADAISKCMEDSGYAMSDVIYNAIVQDMRNCIEESKLCGDDDILEYVQNYYGTFSDAIAMVDFENVIAQA